MQLASYTHAGRRRENQDSVRVETLPDGRVFAAVADGMGGHQGGAYASRRALEVIVDELQAGQAIGDAVAAANAQLNRDAKHPDLSGMGTTAVGVLSEAGAFKVFNVGDSRCYRVTATGIEQLSLDHSFVADALRSGSMDRDAAEATPWKNALTRSLGGAEVVEVDEFGPFAAGEPQVLLLCSDGVYKSVPDDLIERVVRGTPDVTAAAKAVVDIAFRRGSDDNLSAVILELGQLARDGSPLELPASIDAGEHTAPPGIAETPAAPRLGWPEAPTSGASNAGPRSASTVRTRLVQSRRRSMMSSTLFGASALLLAIAVFGSVRSWSADHSLGRQVADDPTEVPEVRPSFPAETPPSPDDSSGPGVTGVTGSLEPSPSGGDSRLSGSTVKANQDTGGQRGTAASTRAEVAITPNRGKESAEGSARTLEPQNGAAPPVARQQAPDREQDSSAGRVVQATSVVVRDPDARTAQAPVPKRAVSAARDTSIRTGASQTMVASPDKAKALDRERYVREAGALPKLPDAARDSALRAIEARCREANKSAQSGMRGLPGVRSIPFVGKKGYDCGVR